MLEGRGGDDRVGFGEGKRHPGILGIDLVRVGSGGVELRVEANVTAFASVVVLRIEDLPGGGKYLAYVAGLTPSGVADHQVGDEALVTQGEGRLSRCAGANEVGLDPLRFPRQSGRRSARRGPTHDPHARDLPPGL